MHLKKFKRFAVIFLSALIFIGVAGSIWAFKMSSFIKTPLKHEAGEMIFSIAPGQSLTSISNQLYQQRLVSSAFYFKVYARIKDAGKKLQAGEYLLSAAHTPKQILNTLLKGKVKLYKFTIPEGWSMEQISQLVENKTSCDRGVFLTLCHDKAFISSLGITSLSLEGYLYPDTYFFPKKASCEKIIRSMVKHFKRVFTKEMQSRAQDMGFSIHEIVTLASIIEKETGDASERPLISSVFHNRLQKNMRLESDPTVIYGIENFDGNIKRKHLRMLTPYNTYRIKGLPLGPIASPGEMSLKAALFPAESDYLFFVSKKDTTHKFSKNIREHNQAVRKYQLRK